MTGRGGLYKFEGHLYYGDGKELEDMGELIIAKRTGDVRLMWDSAKPDEVAHARKRYEEQRALGYMAYYVKNGQQDEVMHKFDPGAEKVTMVPALKGG